MARPGNWSPPLRPLTAFGNGSVSWTPNFITAGNTALVRVTVGGVSGVSNQGFIVTNAGHDYFINDNSTVGDEYTSAVGSDLNSGKTPDAPMASLAALVRAYNLRTRRCGAHRYRFVHAVVGRCSRPDRQRHRNRAGTNSHLPGTEAHTATLDRANSNANGFLFTGADDVTISNLTITGADTGIRLVGAGRQQRDHRFACRYFDIEELWSVRRRRQ